MTKPDAWERRQPPEVRTQLVYYRRAYALPKARSAYVLARHRWRQERRRTALLWFIRMFRVIQLLALLEGDRALFDTIERAKEKRSDGKGPRFLNEAWRLWCRKVGNKAVLARTCDPALLGGAA